MSNDCYALSPPPDSRGSRHKIQDRDHGKRQELRQADALQYIKSIYLSSTMSKGIKIDPKTVEEI